MHIRKIIIVLFLTCVWTYRCLASSPECTGGVKSVFLIESVSCSDLPTFISWLDSCHIRSGILLLNNIVKWDTLSNLDSLRCRNMDIIVYNSHKAPKKDVKKKSEDSFAINGIAPVSYFNNYNIKWLMTIDGAGPTVDQVLPSTVAPNQLLISIPGLSGLKDDTAFMKLAVKHGFDSVLTDSSLLQGGDILHVDDHIILGRSSLMAYMDNPKGDLRDPQVQANAITAIKKAYNIKKETIDFLIPDEPMLYHLDLFVTHAGRNFEGKEQFFIAYSGNEHPIHDKISAELIRKELRNLYPRCDTLLKKLFADNYCLDSIPVFYDQWFVSGINGIRSCRNDTSLYYFPYPIRRKTDPPVEDSVSMLRITDTAIAIMSRRVLVQKVNVPVKYTGGMSSSEAGVGFGGQALHCTMSVIRRD